MTYVKAFLNIDWMVVLVASTFLYIKWGAPLLVSLGLIMFAAIVTILVTWQGKKKKEERPSDG
ncbi:hypothetical protein N781_05330 [Pontibacillus halophilus JSM 076056 = DSM 19796]|uniref:Uncharacterized protein n=1 Tax=Pontibacillus halophilus JSM 076056 = DSM 19796 TaxID=1385510 RepID=A0A0A5GJ50_9BACI|nr:hypothetical protein [Pontibacillus halophilus]KGX91180.1 hypothetical protein N781_05330 [Pontibacillus halophilus JSM 076056 = DSM 19796]